MKINVKKKLAVDPKLQVPTKKKILSCLRNYHNIFNEYYEMTSDNFFASCDNRLRKLSGIDLIFIDGLHAYEQSHRDVLNSLKHLNKKGFIVVHDCNPSTVSQANTECPTQNATEDKSGSFWCGDVWKTILRLRSERNDLNIFVLDCDFGIGVLSKGKNEVLLNIKEKEISSLGYSDLDRNRQFFLNIKPPKYLETFLNSFV